MGKTEVPGVESTRLERVPVCAAARWTARMNAKHSRRQTQAPAVQHRVAEFLMLPQVTTWLRSDPASSLSP